MSKEDDLLQRIGRAVMRHEQETSGHTRYLIAMEEKIRATGVTTNNVMVDLPGIPNPWNVDWTLHWSKTDARSEWGIVACYGSGGRIIERAPVTKAPYDVQSLAVKKIPELLEKLAEAAEAMAATRT